MLKRSGRNARSWHESDSVRRRDRSRPIEGGEKGARRGKDEKRGAWHRMVGNERGREERAREKPAKRQRAEKIRYGAIETQEDIAAAEERRGPRSEAEGRGGEGGGGESGGGRKRHA